MDLLQRLESLEGESQVRRLMARYMDLCDVPRAVTRISELAELFSVDAVWEGIGASTAHTFGQHQGREAVAAFVGSYLPPSEHFALNLHFLTSESIQVHGSRAKGQWIMQQICTYADQRSEVFGTRLNIDFRRVDGAWLIAHFRTQRLFNTALGVSS
ncbi:nuclear transport factor 2 family protein [Pseudomonas sp. Bout1]|uniref:nuclear transport factor 2 family protein n=1 Tax=Pseudomonas sp. Bout1 TaxID=3048600 RepID=UPI002AB50BD5|nr:nuclear transport factor 2 family protein [Pseudomonas sp. Bout1]MDY7532662.1 nuclear transport factor 2 family protein [Pseudomonas sp. Bout1]MEB0189376.1 nuclear transport factor 2 family protein [Pseudomonas sp. Bout1]